MAIISKTFFRETTDALNTTDSSDTVLWSYTLPDDCTAILVYRVHGRSEVDAQHGGLYDCRMFYRTGGGVAVRLTTSGQSLQDGFTNGNWTVNDTVNSNDIRIEVQGDSNDVDWIGFIELTIVDTN